MGAKIRIVMAVLLLGVLLTGCAGKLADYQPENADQQAIKELLAEWQSTWNQGDVQGNLDLYDEEASIMYGSERKIAKKDEYRDILPKRMEAHPKMKLTEPEIEVQGDTATASFGTDAIPFHNELRFSLVKKEGRWLISSWKY